MDKLGALAAFGTAISWSLSAIFFEDATRRVGALAVNFWKVTLAFFLLTISGLALRGNPLPFDASAHAWLYLAISGVLGFVASDYFLLNSYALIGSRTTVVFQALTPLFTALFALIILGESMELLPLCGMVVVVLGILIVVTSRRQGQTQGEASSPMIKKGYLFAFLSTLFQALGLVFSKAGLGDYSPIAGTQIRVLTAILGFGLQAVLTGTLKEVLSAPRRDLLVRKSLGLGSFFGPFVGVTLSLFALQNTGAGTASTLMALTPVLIIPPSALLLKQKVRPLEVVGAGIAVCGAALFFLL